MNDLPFKITALLTGAVVAGEALALLVGMHLLSEGDNAWLSVKNNLFLALDVVSGLCLVYLALAQQGAAWPYAFYILVGLALLTHGYREWEYLAGAANPFCFNAPLFAVNNLKLAGLLAAASLGVPLALVGNQVVNVGKLPVTHGARSGMGAKGEINGLAPTGPFACFSIHCSVPQELWFSAAQIIERSKELA